MKVIICILFALLLFACSHLKEKEIAVILEEWEGKEITFPPDSCLYILGKETNHFPLKKKGGAPKVRKVFDGAMRLSVPLKG